MGTGGEVGARRGGEFDEDCLCFSWGEGGKVLFGGRVDDRNDIFIDDVFPCCALIVMPMSLSGEGRALGVKGEWDMGGRLEGDYNILNMKRQKHRGLREEK